MTRVTAAPTTLRQPPVVPSPRQAPDSAPAPTPAYGASAPLAHWADRLGEPRPEPSRQRSLAHVGGLVSVLALVAYLAWRIGWTLPPSGTNRTVAWLLISFEALPLGGLVVKCVVLWRIDGPLPPGLDAAPPGLRTVVLIPTYDEPAEVLSPTVAAACALQPAHETWVLDDGDRPWVAQLCAAYGARYVARDEHEHAKAGNLNHALALLAQEERDGTGGADVVAVLDCDHVPLEGFLTATLGWFADPEVALVQAPQTFYNAGAFDDDGAHGEQGLFFNVLMPARHHSGAGPFWVGSTSLLRVTALQEVGGVATETITEDMHTTLKLVRAGWRTVYHHQVLAVGLAPATPDQYLVQRRRWGMGAMQVLAHERILAAKRWMSWRDFYEYLNGTLWWLEGVATIVAFAVPVAVMLSGAATSTAPAWAFAIAFSAMFTARLWGAKRLLRGQISWPTAFALRIFRIPIGLACLWWLVSRQSLSFEVTPKGAADERLRGSAPRVLRGLAVLVAAVVAYSAAGLLGVVPWRTTAASTVASGVWLVLAAVVLGLGLRRISAQRYATSRRNAHRIAVRTPVRLAGLRGELVDISSGGASVHLRGRGTPPVPDVVRLVLPGSDSVLLHVVRVIPDEDDAGCVVTLKVPDQDWSAHRTLSLWLFHTPDGAVPALPAGVPAAAVRQG